jgi:hypothetical protein
MPYTKTVLDGSCGCMYRMYLPTRLGLLATHLGTYQKLRYLTHFLLGRASSKQRASHNIHPNAPAVVSDSRCPVGAALALTLYQAWTLFAYAVCCTEYNGVESLGESVTSSITHSDPRHLQATSCDGEIDSHSNILSITPPDP